MNLGLLDPTNEQQIAALRSLLQGEDLERFLLCPPRPDMPFFVFIVEDGKGRIYGSVDIFDVDIRFHSAQLGVWLKDAPTGTGVRAARNVLRLVFSTLPIHRIEARARKSNRQVIALLHKSGFKPEGRLRLAAGDDDVFVFGLLKDEFYSKWGR